MYGIRDNFIRDNFAYFFIRTHVVGAVGAH